MTTMTQTKSQRYSKIVFPVIQNYTDKNSQNSAQIKSYKSLCKKAGSLLRTVGLIQMLVFLKVKGGHHNDLLNHLAVEIKQISQVTVNEGDQLIEHVRRLNLPEYMHTSSQMLKLLQWHKRIADILIKGE